MTIRPRLFETFAVFVTVLAAYGALLSEIAVDDVARYIHELGEDRFFWDIGHVWMQPLALLVYRAVGGLLSSNATLEAINVFSVAAGVAVFHLTLREQGHSLRRSIAGAAFVAVSFNLITLGPTAHIKLLVFPALALSLRYAMRWEAGGAGARRDAIASGVWLGVGCNLLISVLPSGIILAALVLWHSLKEGMRIRQAIREVLPFALGLTISGAGCLLAAYATAVATSTTSATDLLGFVFGGLKEKQDLHVGLASWTEVPLRFGFSVANNFAFLPSLGPLGRAWLWGMLPPLGVKAWVLAGQAVLALLVLASLAWACWAGLRRMNRPDSGVRSSLAFVAGATAFSAYYNLNDPEHWFQFTLPLVLLILQLRLRRLDLLALGILLPAIAVTNLAGYGIPKAQFALAEREAEMRDALGPDGLYIGYGAYPGEPDSSLFELRGIPRFSIDLVQASLPKANAGAVLGAMDQAIDAALERKGRVLVFRALDPFDWRGPVMQVTLAGLSRRQLQAHLEAKYLVTGPVFVAGFQAWELKRSPSSR